MLIETVSGTMSIDQIKSMMYQTLGNKIQIDDTLIDMGIVPFSIDGQQFYLNAKTIDVFEKQSSEQFGKIQTAFSGLVQRLLRDYLTRLDMAKKETLQSLYTKEDAEKNKDNAYGLYLSITPGEDGETKTMLSHYGISKKSILKILNKFSQDVIDQM